MLLLENRLHFLRNSGWCTRTRSGCEIFFAFALNFACGSWKQAQGNCTHVSAVIGDEGVRAESPAQIGGLAGRHESCRIHIFTTKNAYLTFLSRKYVRIGKLVAEPFGPESWKAKKIIETDRNHTFSCFRGRKNNEMLNFTQVL